METPVHRFRARLEVSERCDMQQHPCTATRHACDSCINQAVHVDVSVSGVLCCAHVCAVEGMHAVQG